MQAGKKQAQRSALEILLATVKTERLGKVSVQRTYYCTNQIYIALGSFLWILLEEEKWNGIQEKGYYSDICILGGKYIHILSNRSLQIHCGEYQMYPLVNMAVRPQKIEDNAQNLPF